MGPGGARARGRGGVMPDSSAAAVAAPDGWDCHVHVFDAAAAVAPGHYRPTDRPLSAIEALAQAHGVHHLVLVQPSVYGTDNSVLLRALDVTPGRHRAVLVADASLVHADLRRLHAQGVRGVRFNLVSPVGNGAQDFSLLAPSLRAMGWHAQWYVQPKDLPEVVRAHAGSGVTCVLDHLAGFHADLANDDVAWSWLGRLAGAGAWIKLSGWYRLQAVAPYDTLATTVARVAELFGRRMVWGSDWPHTSFSPDALPTYEDQWAPVKRALVPDAIGHLRREAAARLYG